MKVLPTLVCFKGGVAKRSVVGFDGLGSDDFPTLKVRVVDAQCAGVARWV